MAGQTTASTQKPKEPRTTVHPSQEGQSHMPDDWLQARGNADASHPKSRAKILPLPISAHVT